MQFFDRRREYALTDRENDGRPKPPWRDLISEMERRPDRAPATYATGRQNPAADKWPPCDRCDPGAFGREGLGTAQRFAGQVFDRW